MKYVGITDVRCIQKLPSWLDSTGFSFPTLEVGSFENLSEDFGKKGLVKGEEADGDFCGAKNIGLQADV